MFPNEHPDPKHNSGFTYQPFKSNGIDTRLPVTDLDDLQTSDTAHELDSGSNVGLHKTLLSYYVQELYVQETQRREMMQDEDFFDGIQWDAEDAKALRERGQMPLVYNVIAPAVNWLLGTERRARTDYKVLPRRKEGSKPAERKTQLMKYISDVNRQPFHISRAFADTVKVGIGWLENGYQGDDGKEPVFCRYESWRNILWDSRAMEPDLSDSRFMFRAKWTDLDVAIPLFPDREAVIRQAAFTNMDIGTINIDNYSDAAMDEAEARHDFSIGIDGNQVTRQRVRLIECWYKVPTTSSYLKGGEFSGEPYDPYSRGHRDALQNDPDNVAVVKRTKMRVHVAIFTTKGLLHNGPSPYRHDAYPFTPIWGNRRGSDGMPYGLIRNMKDIQRDINKRASKAQHILSSSKIIMDEGAVEDIDELAEEAARPDAVIVKKQGKHLEIDSDRALAAPHLELMSRNIDMIQQMSGITDEAMGRTTNATSGKAIMARQNQGSVAVAHFLDNLRYALSLLGEKNLSLIEQYFDEKKSFRITNARGAPSYIEINDGLPENDIIATKADYIISEEDWQATTRQAQVTELMSVVRELAPADPKIAMTLLDLLVESMDIPSKDEVVARIRSITGMEDPDTDPDDMDPEMLARREAKEAEAAMHARAAEAEIADKEAGVAEKLARANKITTEAMRQQKGLTKDNLDSIHTALQAAMSVASARPIAPIADQLIAEARERGEDSVAHMQGGQSPTHPIM